MSDIINPETGQPLRFPDWREEAYQRAQEFQRLTPTERIQEILAMMAWGLRMVQTTPRRAAIEKIWAEQEADWQRIQKDLMVKHGQRDA